MQRAWLWLAISGGIGAAAAMGGYGCSGSTAEQDAGPTATDATAADSAKEAGPDAGKPATDATAPCTSDADLNTFTVPDANVGDTGINPNVCVTCARQKCKENLDQCQAICACREVVQGSLTCIAQGQPILSCASALQGAPPDVQQIGLALAQCVLQQCPTECPIGGFLPDGGLDGGDAKPPVTDASSPSDAGPG